MQPSPSWYATMAELLEKSFGFVGAHCDAFELLELAEEVLD